MIRRSVLNVVCVLLMTACALSEEPSPTPMPPLTIEPVAELHFEGDCNVNQDLANWLQFTSYHVGEFANMVATTATMSLSEMRENVQTMVATRLSVSQTAAPDCAEPAHRLVIETMNRAIEAFQSHVNGEDVDLNQVVAEILGQFDQINVIYEDFNTRLQEQLDERTTSDS